MTPPPDQEMTPAASLGPILLCIIFGANAVAIKVSLSGIGPFTAAGIRFSLAAAVIALWALATGRRFRVARQDLKPLLVLCAMFTVQLSLFYLGISGTLATRSALIVNIVPFFVLIFAHLFIPSDRINRRKIWGLVMGFSGVALVLADGSILGGGWLWGDAVVFLAATIWAANAVFTKTIIHRFSAFQLVLYPMLCAAPAQLLEGWLWDEAMVFHLDGAILTAVLYQSLICAAFGFVLWNSLLHRYGASALHSFVFIMPVSGVAAGGMILDEPITPTIIAAVIMVAVGIGLVNLRPRRTPPTYPLGRGY